MKKKYSKPCIAVENFVLQEFIAGSCSVKMNYANDTCVTEDKLTTGGIDDKLAAQIKAIIQAGIRTVVYDSDKYEGTPSNRAAKRMFDAAGVNYVQYRKTGRMIRIEV